jgi:tetratricopeptide (TPR) repeat protein
LQERLGVPGIVAAMSPRARVSLLVAAAAAAAAGITIAATALTRTDLSAEPVATPRSGVPPLILDLGVRTDTEARALRRATALYGRNRRAGARRIFERYDSVEARVGAALSAWPEGFEQLERLARDHPESGAVQLALGLGAFWKGLLGDAERLWRRAAAAEPDSTYAVRADDLLHPELPVPGVPTFVPSFASPAPLKRLSPPEQYAFLRRRAEEGSVRDVLLFGAALQRLGRPLSARREFERGAELAPNDPEALTAVAVGYFDKDQPAQAFSRLGPLAQRFPRAATVRFHLGLLLVWLGRIDDAKRQFRLARDAEPGSIPARQAGEFLRRLPAS